MTQVRSLPLLMTFLAACSTSDVDRVMNAVTEESVMRHVRVLADDSLMGRRPGGPGEERAITYIAGQLASFGAEAAGENGTYFQSVKILSQRLQPGSMAEVRKGTRRIPLMQRDDMVMFSGAPREVVRVNDREVVFVGYGVDAPEQEWDDFKDYDVRGKVLVFLNNDPPSDDPAVFGGPARTYYGRWTYKYEIAAEKGAAGAIIIHTDSSAGYPWGVVANSWGGDNLMLASEAEGSSLDLLGWWTDAATRRVLALAGKDLDALVRSAARRDFRPVPLGVSLRARMSLALRSIEGKNVIGLLRGSDPELSEEAVVFTSHHDHFGIGFTIAGDSVYNGALDNASGCAMTLELARAFGSLPERPKRSLLFCFVTAEEDGLLGSQYIATHPTLPLARMAALINIDGFNILGRTEDITFLGYDRSSLGTDIDAVAGVMGMTISPDPSPEQGLFYRSDHFSFAKVGVPAVSMKTGTRFIGQPDGYWKQKDEEYRATRYHQPSDQLGPDWQWDLTGMLQQFEFVTRLTLRIANADVMPAWNEGDEFEAARRESLRQDME